jgi:benzoyl-CoA reductase/2-hydroxyglutaryl-CoA dehydratase subunit BcrC/BadD/HgdB
MREIGLTTTVPIEIIYAAGCIPLDLNNLFITSPSSEKLILEAERMGFPRNTCSWIKGIWGVVKERGIKEIVAVTQGDCSNTHALIEILQFQGVKVFPFAYPFDRSRELLYAQMEQMRRYFQVSWEDIKRKKEELDEIRALAHEIDRLCYEDNLVSGYEDHLYLVSTSDMKGDPQAFKREMEEFIKKAKTRKPFREDLRLGYVGVPPIFTDLYQKIEALGGRVVYNELQRQFSMPFHTDDIVEQYLLYTYPYSFFYRLEDIKREVKRREIHGLIHYVQSFCFRQMQDIILRKELKTPILTLEGDRPGPLDVRTELRLEAFMESLRAKRW